MRSFSFCVVFRRIRLTLFRPARVRVRCPDGIGSRPRIAASWTSERDWIVPAEPTQVLNPVLRTASAALRATARIAFLTDFRSLSLGGSS